MGALGAVLALGAAGCGTSQLAGPTRVLPVHPKPPKPAKPAPGPEPAKPRPARVQQPFRPPAVRLPLVTVRVLDGDTGKPIPRPVVTVRGGQRRGRTLFALRRRALLQTTVWAPHYAARTLRLPFDRFRRVTVRLYRPDGQWPMYGVDPARTQAHAGIRLRPPFRIVWGRNLGTLIEFPASVSDGAAYVTNLHGKLYALSMADGKTIWKRDLETFDEASSPAVVGDTLVVHRKAGSVLVLDRRNGRVLWTYATAGQIESSPVVVDGVDYLGDWAGNVYALDLKRRSVRWVHDDGCKITASAAIADGAVYLGDYCGRVLALSASSGATRWTASAGSPVYGAAAVSGGRVFVPSRDTGALYAFTTGGSYLWRVSTGGYVYSAPAVLGGRVYFGSYTGVLYCVSAATGAVQWTLGLGGRISGSPAIVDGVVYAGSFAHRIVGADARTGRSLFTFPHGEYVPVSGNRARLLLYGWSSVWAVEPARKKASRRGTSRRS